MLKHDQLIAIMAASIYSGFCAHRDNPKNDEEKREAARAAVKQANEVYYAVMRLRK